MIFSSASLVALVACSYKLVLFSISSLTAFLLAVACLTIDNRFAIALAALSCLWKIAVALTSSEVMVFLFASLLIAFVLAIRVGVKLGMSVVAPCGKAVVGYPFSGY